MVCRPPPEPLRTYADFREPGPPAVRAAQDVLRIPRTRDSGARIEMFFPRRIRSISRAAFEFQELNLRLGR